jgi:hypothetical protein
MSFWDNFKIIGTGFKMMGKKVLTPLANHVVSMINKSEDAVEHVVDTGVKLVDAVGKGATGLGDMASGLGSLLSNPIMIVGGIAVALLVVNKLK